MPVYPGAQCITANPEGTPKRRYFRIGDQPRTLRLRSLGLPYSSSPALSEESTEVLGAGLKASAETACETVSLPWVALNRNGWNNITVFSTEAADEH
jgi:hypothetical protein